MESKPSYKEVVLELMKFVKSKDEKSSEHSLANTKKRKVWLTYQCPREACSKKTVTFLSGSGFKNPFSHLTTCYSKGKTAKEKEDHVFKLYLDAVEKRNNKGGSIRSHFDSNQLSDYDKAMFEYARLIIMKRLPVSYVEDHIVRSFSKYSVNISHKIFVEVLFKLVELVEKKISNEIKDKKGALLFDGWTKTSTHYIGLILSYCDYQNGIKIPRTTLIAMSPMAKVCYDSDTNDDYSDSDSELLRKTLKMLILKKAIVKMKVCIKKGQKQEIVSLLKINLIKKLKKNLFQI